METVLANLVKEDYAKPYCDSVTTTNDSSTETSGEKKNLKPILNVTVA